jgi:1-acyl-sn-glycerol-3-phosphate acyltransferase
MKDIEPMLEYKPYTFGLHTVYNILVFIYLIFIAPLYTILHYGVKTEKEALRSLTLQNLNIVGCHIHKVSKREVIVDKNIMYLSNHLSWGDFFMDPYILNYNCKFISLTKIKLLLPLVALLTSQINMVIFIKNMKDKNEIVKNMNDIEILRHSDTNRNISFYPEGMRRPHRPNVSAVLKKGFIYHSFDHNLPLQIVHTTNKDYIIDDEKFECNKGIHAFTYYGQKIEPQKLKARYEKKYNKEYTKDDYYEDVYKQWCKIWKKMDKYRIDSYIEKGMTYEDALKQTEKLSKSYPIIEDKIINGDTPISNSFILIRSVCWAIIYYIIFKIIEKVFTLFVSCSTQINKSGIITPSFCSRFSFLKNFLFSPVSPVSCVN